MIPQLYLKVKYIHYGSLSVVFIPLRSSTNKELFKTLIEVATMRNMDGATSPSYCLKVSAMLNSLHSSMNQELI